MNDTDFGIESQTNYKEVRTLVDEFREAGYHHVNWDGRDNFGKRRQAPFTFIVGGWKRLLRIRKNR